MEPATNVCTCGQYCLACHFGIPASPDVSSAEGETDQPLLISRVIFSTKSDFQPSLRWVLFDFGADGESPDKG
jgi:hypothetical protein